MHAPEPFRREDPRASESVGEACPPAEADGRPVSLTAPLRNHRKE